MNKQSVSLVSFQNSTLSQMVMPDSALRGSVMNRSIKYLSDKSSSNLSAFMNIISFYFSIATGAMQEILRSSVLISYNSTSYGNLSYFCFLLLVSFGFYLV